MQGIDFNSKSARIIKTGINNDSLSNPLRISESYSTAISDCNGQLLFYTNGFDLWNKIDTIMDNGRLQFINRSSVGSHNRNCLIIPIPNNDNLYYVFYSVYLTDNNSNNGLKMALVDLSKQNGLGSVIFKDSVVDSNIIPSSNLTYAKNANDTDIWLIVSANQNTMYSFRITSAGLTKKPVFSSVYSNNPFSKKGLFNFEESGYINMTLDFRKLVVTNITPQITINGNVLIYDFDRMTGKFSNEKTIVGYNEFKDEIVKCSAFSPNDSLIYFSLHPTLNNKGKYFSRILQYNRFSGSKGVVKSFLPPSGFTVDPVSFEYFAIKNAPDGKIYIFLLNKIYRINQPNKKGTACNINYWDSLNLMNYGNIQHANDLRIFALPNVYMPQLKLYFNSSTELNPCTDSTSLTYWGDTTYYKLVWYFGDGDSLVQVSPNIKNGMKIRHQYVKDGNYEVSLKSFHAVCNLKKVYADSIIVKRNPQKIIWQPLSPHHGCYSDTVLVALKNNLANKLNINWGDSQNDTISINDVSLDSIRHTYLTNSVFYRQIMLSSVNGCIIKWKDTVTGSFNPKPIQKLVLNGNSLLSSPLQFNSKILIQACEPEKISVSDTGGLVKQINVHWNNGDSTIAGYIVSNLILKNNISSPFTFGLNTIKTTNIYGCTQLDTFYSKIYAKPKAIFAFDFDSLCLRNNNFKIRNNVIYSGWSDSLKNNIDWGDGNTNNQISHNYLQSGIKPIQIITKGEFECSDTFKNIVVVIDPPKVDVSVLTPMQCFNSNNFEVKTTKNDKYNVNWGDKQRSTLVNKTASHHYLNSGIYSLIAEAENSFGCKDSIILTLNVVPHPKASFILKDSTSCLLNNKIDVTTNTLFSNMDSVSSTLYLGDGWYFKQKSGNFNQTYTYTQPKAYRIKLIVESTQGCLDSVEHSMDIFPSPYFSNSFNNSICLGDSIVLTDNWKSSDKLNKITWQIQSGVQYVKILNSGTDSTMFKYKPTNTGLFNISTTADNTYGCKSQGIATFNIFPHPIADFEFIKIESNLNEVNFQFKDKSTHATNWNWNFNLHGNNGSSFLQNPNYTFIDTGQATVTLRITDDNNCKDTITKKILAYPSFNFYFPNAMTINQDGLNESFGTNAPQFVRDFQLDIFNRWGQLIYSTKDKYENWQPDTEGVYVFKVYIKDLFLKQSNYSGTVTVLK